MLLNRDDDDWFESFKMKKETFKFICDTLHEPLKPKPNPYTKRASITVSEQVAICIFYLGSCAELRVIGEIFGYAKSTIWKCVKRVCDAIVELLLHTWIRMPSDEECEQQAIFFQARTGLPQITGAIDGSHIPITAPQKGLSDYINRKGWPSLNMQAFVDSKAM